VPALRDGIFAKDGVDAIALVIVRANSNVVFLILIIHLRVLVDRNNIGRFVLQSSALQLSGILIRPLMQVEYSV